MNPFELLLALLILAALAAFVFRVRKQGATRVSSTNLILVGMGLVAFYFYTESENRAAIRTGDWDRCWGSQCHSQIAGDAAERLSRGY